jgi:hypothetical protein
MTTLTEAQIRNLLDYVKQAYPDWQGFPDPRFMDDEVTYKQTAVQKAQDLLQEADLSDLITQGRYDELIDRLKKVAQSSKNLLYLAVPKQGDLGVINQDNLDRGGFCRAFFDLIYGSGSSPERLGRYAAWLDHNQLPNKWTFPTFFLYVCHPRTEMFVKPRMTSWFLKFAGAFETLPANPTPEIYAELLNLSEQLWNALQDYQPRDNVDIQGFIWAAYSVSQRKKKLAKPFNKMFRDWTEAEWAFELLETTAETLGIQGPEDTLFCTTFRHF